MIKTLTKYCCSLLIAITGCVTNYDSYENRVNTIDVSEWTEMTYNFINEVCYCCPKGSKIYPTVGIAFINENKLREKLLMKLDSTLKFNSSYEIFNIYEVHSNELTYRVFVWLDNKEPLFSYRYVSMDQDFEIEEVDLTDPNSFVDFLEKGHLKGLVCEVDTTLDVLERGSIHTKFSLKNDSLRAQVREVLLN